MNIKKMPKLNQIYCSDTLEFLKNLPDGCIDLAMTSPPYWGLRDYQVSGQLGLEPNFEEYISKSLVIYQEIKRVLKPTGSFYLNISDTYSGSGMGYGQTENSKGFQNVFKQSYYPTHNHPALQSKCQLPKKSLIGIPWRIALKMVEQGWILRNAIVWHKPNAMPSSVKDRLNTTYEFVFHFVKAKKYYYNLDAIRVLHKATSLKRIQYPINPFGCNGKVRMTGSSKGNLKNVRIKLNPKGKNPGDFWQISTQSFKGQHFATYPEKLCEIPIKASCPQNGIVLDPFSGSGTTCLMAKKLGRNYIGIDLNPYYCQMASDRIGSASGGKERINNYENK
ncbi:MAG: site-specific DNA-methyltransferase [bacterium]